MHTIGAGFDEVRRLLPVHQPKLSKLAILRIACRYIQLLAALIGEDLSPDGSRPSPDECTRMLVETIDLETRLKRLDNNSEQFSPQSTSSSSSDSSP